MRRVLTGQIRDGEAWIAGHIQRGTLVLAPPAELRLVVDTGFTGTLALPSIALRRIRLQALGTEWYSLANGQEVDSAVYAGRVRVGRRIHEVEMVSFGSEALIGMELLQRLGDEVRLQFRTARIEVFSCARPRSR